MGDNTKKKNIKVFNDEDTMTNPEYADKEHAFKIITGKREFFFATDTEHDLNKWFKSFHSTHSSGDVSATEDSYTITHDQDDDEYSNILDRNESDLMDSDGDMNTIKEEEADDEKKEDDAPKSMKHRNSKTPLMDIIDPEHTGKWVDIENASIEQEQSTVLLSPTNSPKRAAKKLQMMCLVVSFLFYIVVPHKPEK